MQSILQRPRPVCSTLLRKRAHYASSPVHSIPRRSASEGRHNGAQAFDPKTASLTTPPQSLSISSHSSLDTYLKYAQQAGLSLTSTVYVGTEYEYLCQSSLKRLGLDLVRTGGRSDLGIDLAGTWILPKHSAIRNSSSSPEPPLHVLVQCKALKAGPRPNLVRELEGMLAGAPAGHDKPGTVGLLCATKPATKGVREAIRDSDRPLVWVQVEKIGDRETRVRQMLWNERVERIGMRGVNISVRRGDGQDDGGEIVLVR